MNRRDLLIGTGLVGTIGLTGCTGSGDSAEDPSEEIVRFFVTNEDDVQRSIQIAIEADGEVQASGSGSLPPAGEQEDPFRYGFPTIGVPVTAVIQSDNGTRRVDWDPAECAELRVDVQVKSGEPEIERRCQ